MIWTHIFVNNSSPWSSFIFYTLLVHCFFQYFFFILVSQGALQGVSTTNVRRQEQAHARDKKRAAQLVKPVKGRARVGQRARVLNLFKVL